jgi:hypothetical protein
MIFLQCTLLKPSSIYGYELLVLALKKIQHTDRKGMENSVIYILYSTCCDLGSNQGGGHCRKLLVKWRHLIKVPPLMAVSMCRVLRHQPLAHLFQIIVLSAGN